MISCCSSGLAVAFLFASVHVASAADSRRSYRLLRDEERWNWLRNNPTDRDVFDPLKYVPLLGDRDDFYLTFGGETRQWIEGYHNELWGTTGREWTGAWLQRYMLHADAHLSRWVRAFVQFKSGFEVFHPGGPRSVNDDHLDVNALFADISLIPGKDIDDPAYLVVRAGRQELSFGSGRLIDVREAPNVRFGWDGARLIAQAATLRLDAFLVRPQRTRPGVFDDATDTTQALWGSWLAKRSSAFDGDAYYLGLRRDSFRYQRVTGRERRHTFGARARVKAPRWEAEVEATYQTGDVGDVGLAAWSLATEGVMRSPDSFTLRPVLTAGFGVTSGDSGRPGSKLGTFSPLFPRGAYFGLLAANGASNNLGPHLSAAISPTRAFILSAEVWGFWRTSRADGVYGVPGVLIRPGSPADARFLGTQTQTFLTWVLDTHLSLNGTLGVFWTGAFFRTNLPGRNLGYAALWATYKF